MIHKSGSKASSREKSFVGLGRGLADAQVKGHETPLEDLLVTVPNALGCRTEERGGPIQTIDLDEDRTSLRRAAPAQYRVGALDVTTPQIGGHPDVAAQPHSTILERDDFFPKIVIPLYLLCLSMIFVREPGSHFSGSCFSVPNLTFASLFGRPRKRTSNFSRSFDRNAGGRRECLGQLGGQARP